MFFLQKHRQNIPSLREGFRKKKPYFLWSFAKPEGGGSAREVKKPYCFFEKVFFQRACRIILGPPKHVLHLVWSVLGISTAIKTALKVAPTGSSKWSINGKVNHFNCKRKKEFSMGASVKFVLAIIDSISEKKNGG